MLSPYLTAIEAQMRSAIRSDEPLLDDFYRWMHYHLGWANEQFQPAMADGGKRLRPIFCLLACECVSGQYKMALPAAAAIEILHNFSLIHDDIEDGDERRRHRPTLWTLVGIPHAINTGDALFALAQRELLRTRAAGVTIERILRSAELFQQTCVQLVEGQYLDMHGEQLASGTLAYYRQMVGGKTAALLGAATAIGACLGTDNAAVVEQFQAFGIELGLAFQMTDDILGLWGDPEITGKAAGADLRRKKKSLPIILSQSAGGELSDTLRQLFAQPEISDADIGHTMRLMDNSDIRRQAEHEADHHRQQATRTLDTIITGGVASPTAAQMLTNLANSLTRRDH